MSPLASAGRSLAARGVLFPAPRRMTEPLTPPSPPELPRPRRSRTHGRSRKAETDSSAFPVKRTRHPRPEVPSIDKLANPPRGHRHRSHAIAHASARRGFAAATRFSTPLRSRRSPDPALAITADPPLARPRPRELVVRLEEDRAHVSLGQDAACRLLQHTTRRAGTPITSVRFSPA